MTVFYDSLFLLSLILAAIYTILWHKHFDSCFTIIFALIPVSNLGAAIMAHVTELSAALVGVIVSYIGGCYLILFMMLAILNLCGITIKNWVRVVLLVITSIVFLSSTTIGSSDIFYKAVTGELIKGRLVLHKEYSFMHLVFYLMVLVYLLTSAGLIIYSIRKKDVSVKNLKLMFFSELFTALGFFGGKLLGNGIELTPLMYIVAEIFFLLIIRRISLYDVTDTVIDTIIANGDTGFVSFDDRFNYLGSNDIAKGIFPCLSKLKIDSKASRYPEVYDSLIVKIKDFIIDESKEIFFKEHDDKIYQIEISRLFDGHKNRGFLLYITDDSKDQKYISLLDKFNDKLQEEVAQKTADIVAMHNKLILGMATMVESRDNSTGGHIKRTSDGVRILLDEIMKDNELGITEDFCANLIKAAPMHDLGKIAVDDAVLRKPGRFTDEEFEKMKHHAAEGARIVHAILEGTDNPDFKRIAENVAHYHHERWDGSGYPEGLKGETIPLEARIMAVADVYDALVSKRVYKDSMSFEQADKIIMEGMGRHFDKRLEKYYVAARSRLEVYYSKVGQ